MIENTPLSKNIVKCRNCGRQVLSSFFPTHLCFCLGLKIESLLESEEHFNSVLSRLGAGGRVPTVTQAKNHQTNENVLATNKGTNTNGASLKTEEKPLLSASQGGTSTAKPASITAPQKTTTKTAGITLTGTSGRSIVVKEEKISEKESMETENTGEITSNLQNSLSSAKDKAEEQLLQNKKKKIRKIERHKKNESENSKNEQKNSKDLPSEQSLKQIKTEKDPSQQTNEEKNEKENNNNEKSSTNPDIGSSPPSKKRKRQESKKKSNKPNKKLKKSDANSAESTIPSNSTDNSVAEKPSETDSLQNVIVKTEITTNSENSSTSPVAASLKKIPSIKTTSLSKKKSQGITNNTDSTSTPQNDTATSFSTPKQSKSPNVSATNPNVNLIPSIFSPHTAQMFSASSPNVSLQSGMGLSSPMFPNSNILNSPAGILLNSGAAANFASNSSNNMPSTPTSNTNSIAGGSPTNNKRNQNQNNKNQFNANNQQAAAALAAAVVQAQVAQAAQVQAFSGMPILLSHPSAAALMNSPFIYTMPYFAAVNAAVNAANAANNNNNMNAGNSASTSNSISSPKGSKPSNNASKPNNNKLKSPQNPNNNMNINNIAGISFPGAFNPYFVALQSNMNSAGASPAQQAQVQQQQLALLAAAAASANAQNNKAATPIPNQASVKSVATTKPTNKPNASPTVNSEESTMPAASPNSFAIENGDSATNEGDIKSSTASKTNNGAGAKVTPPKTLANNPAFAGQTITLPANLAQLCQNPLFASILMNKTVAAANAAAAAKSNNANQTNNNNGNSMSTPKTPVNNSNDKVLSNVAPPPNVGLISPSTAASESSSQTPTSPLNQSKTNNNISKAPGTPQKQTNTSAAAAGAQKLANGGAPATTAGQGGNRAMIFPQGFLPIDPLGTINPCIYSLNLLNIQSAFLKQQQQLQQQQQQLQQQQQQKAAAAAGQNMVIGGASHANNKAKVATPTPTNQNEVPKSTGNVENLEKKSESSSQ